MTADVHALTSRRAKSRFVPELKLPLDTIRKFELTPRQESSMVSTLSQKGSLSDASGIQSFMEDHVRQRERENAASAIQHFWRRHKRVLIMKDKLTKMAKNRKRSLTFTFQAWRLALGLPANQCCQAYNQVTSIMKDQRWITWKNGNWITRNQKSLSTFSEFMKTGVLTYRPGGILLVSLFVSKIYRRDLTEIFDSWLDLAQERHVLRQVSPRLQLSAFYRKNYGPLFMAYIFWRRFVTYKRTKDIDRADRVRYEFYVSEWRVFYHIKDKERNKEVMAVNHWNTVITRAPFVKLMLKTARKKKRRIALKGCEGIHERSVMKTALGVFKYYRNLANMVLRKRRRIVGAWYQVVYTLMRRRERKRVALQRIKLKVMLSTFKRWALYTKTYQVQNAMLRERMAENRTFVLRYVFARKGDWLHYGLTTALHAWKKLNVMRKRAKSFITWSVQDAKLAILKRYTFDLIKENANKRVNRVNYYPFRGEADKIVMSKGPDDSPLQNQKKKKKLETIREAHEHTELHVFKASTKDIIIGVRNATDSRREPNDWKNATRDQIRTLFFHIAVAIANRSALTPVVTKTEKWNQVVSYQSRECLFTDDQIQSKLRYLDEIEAIRRRGVKERMRRNVCIGLDLDAHDLAMKLGEKNVNFKPSLVRIQDELQPIYDDTSKIVDERRIFLTEGRPPQKPNIHPMLRPVAIISEELEKSDMSYIRKPDEAVICKIGESNNTKRAHQDELNAGPENDTYEAHRSITKSSTASAMMRKRDCHLNELKELKEKVREVCGPGLSGEQGDENVTEGQKFDELQSIVRVRVDIPSHENIPPDRLAEGNSLAAPQNISVEKALQFLKKDVESESYEEEEDFGTRDDDMPNLLEMISKSYLKDDEYMKLTPEERKNAIVGRYFTILNLLLGNRKPRKKFKPRSRLFEEPEGPSKRRKSAIRTVSLLLRKLEPPQILRKTAELTDGQKELMERQKKKVNRPSLFHNRRADPVGYTDENGVKYEVSKVAAFRKCLFTGDSMIIGNPLEENIDTLSDDSGDEGFDPSIRHLKEKEQKRKESMAEEIPGFDKLINAFDSFLADGTNDSVFSRLSSVNDKSGDDSRSQVLRILDGLAHRAVAQQAQSVDFGDPTAVVVKEEQPSESDSLTSSRSRSRLQSSRTKTPRAEVKRPESRKHRAFPADIHKRKSQLIVIEKKLTFTNDLISAISEGVKMMRPAVIKYYEDISKIKPFEGLDLLREKAREWAEEYNNRPPLYIPPPPEPKEVPFDLNVGRPTSRTGATTRGKRLSSAFDTQVKKKMVKTNDPMSDGLIKVENITITRVETKEPVRAKTTFGLSLRRNIAADSRPPTPRGSSAVGTARTTGRRDPMICDTSTHQMSQSRTCSRTQLSPMSTTTHDKVTEDDIEFFLFCTPYVLPPRIINEMLDESD